jgi:hypothetical protein
MADASKAPRESVKKHVLMRVTRAVGIGIPAASTTRPRAKYSASQADKSVVPATTRGRREMRIG